MKKILILTVGMVCGVSMQAMRDRIVYDFRINRVLREPAGSPFEPVVSPLEDAVSREDFEGVKSLIEQSKDQNNSIEEAMRLAGREGRLEIAQLLFRLYPQASSQEALISLLDSASRRGKFELVKFAIEKGADVEGGKEDVFGTPLMGAASRGHTQIAKYLIEHGANANTHRIVEGTALKAALKDGHFDTARIILTTIQPCEVQRIKTAVASIRFGISIPRDVRNILTLELIRQFTQEHMKYASGLLNDAISENDYEFQKINQEIANIKEPQSWDSLRSEVGANFRHALAHPSIIHKKQCAEKPLN